jgi:hypothetical protein
VIVTNGPLPDILRDGDPPPKMLALYMGVRALESMVAENPECAVRQMNRIVALAHIGRIGEIGIVRCPAESKSLGPAFYGYYSKGQYPHGVMTYNPKEHVFRQRPGNGREAELTRLLGAATTSALRGYFAAQFLVNAGDYLGQDKSWNAYVKEFVPTVLLPPGQTAAEVNAAA